MTSSNEGQERGFVHLTCALEPQCTQPSPLIGEGFREKVRMIVHRKRMDTDMPFVQFDAQEGSPPLGLDSEVTDVIRQHP